MIMRRLSILILFATLPALAAAQGFDTTATLQKIDSLIKANRSLTDQKKYTEALAAIESAEKLTLETVGKNHAAWGSCLFNRGRTLDFEERHTEAEPFYLQAQDFFEKNSGEENPDYASCLFNLGKMCDDMARYPEAEIFYQKTMQVRAKTLGKTHPRYGSAAKNLGALYLKMHEYEKAEPLCLEAAAIEKREAEKSPKPYAGSLNNLAILYQNLGHYEKAEAYCQASRLLCEKTVGTSHPDYARSLYTQAKMCQRIGNFDKAEQLFVAARRVFEQTVGTSHPDYANCVNSLATLYWELGVYDKAEAGYLEAKSIFEKTERADEADHAGTLVNLGLLCLHRREFGRAEALLSEAKKLFETHLLDLEHPYYQNCLNNLASLFMHTARFEQAETMHLEAKALRAKTYGPAHPVVFESLHNLAVLYARWGKLELAEPLFLKVKNFREHFLGKGHPYYTTTLNELAQVYWANGQTQAAGACFGEADTLGKRLMLQAARHLSDIEMLAYAQKFSSQLGQHFSFAQASGQPRFWGNAFDNALFFKGFQLYSATQFRNRVAQKPELAERFAALTACHRRLAGEYAKPVSARENVPELEAQANDLEKELTRSVAGFGQAIRQVTWQEVQAALQPGDAAIEFVHFQYRSPAPTDSVLYAALVVLPGKEAPIWVNLFEEKQLAGLFPNEQTPASVNAFYKNPALYRLIWQPLETHLAGTERVFCSPTGLLSQIAFPAVQTAEGGKLIERFEVHCLGSTRQLVFEKTPSEFVAGRDAADQSGQEAVLFGGIRYDPDSVAIAAANLENAASEVASKLYTGAFRGNGGEAWSFLKWTEIEVGEISDLLAEAHVQSRIWKGFAASEEAFYRLGRQGFSPKILHFATHAFAFPEKAGAAGGQTGEPVFKISEHPMMRSGLVLAGANRAWTGGQPFQNMEDGILTAYEISQTDLGGTELAVLSACESGLGKIEGYEGVQGLARAFKIAGARHLLVSLWPVSDFQTEELMSAFYAEWLRGGVSVPAAFRAAQRRMLAKFPGEAFAWAGFVLVE